MGYSKEARRYLERLGEIPFVHATRLRHYPSRNMYLWDYVLEIRVGEREWRLFVEEKRSKSLSPYLIQDLIVRSQRLERGEWILFAPYVSGPAGRRLRELNVNYIDLAGNCHLALGESHVATIEGRRPLKREEVTRGIGAAGYRVMFAILARPSLLRGSVRDMADAAGVSKSGVSLTLRRLQDDGLVGRGKSGPAIIRPRSMLDRWIVGYETLLRPRLEYGRYSARAKLTTELDALIESVLSSQGSEQGTWRDSEGTAIRWAWGGSAAGYRLIGHYRGTETVIHFSASPATVARKLGFRPNTTGEIAFLGTPGNLAFEGEFRNTVDPLLVYAELLASKDERARESALEIYDRFLAARW